MDPSKQNLATQQNKEIQVNQKEIVLQILIVGRIYEEQETFKITRQTIQEFKKHIKCRFYMMDQKTLEKVQLIYKDIQCVVFKSEKHAANIDYVVTIGGDGTILYAAKQFIQEKQTPPFISFQKGTLGFMCQFSVNSLPSVIERAVLLYQNKIKPEQYPIDKPLFNVRKTMRLRVQIIQKDNQSPSVKTICVNQVAITREHAQKIVLGIYWNKQLLTQTSGDGILISTPTGSTAYALSAGGPIISNGVNCIQIVPIAPYSLSFRPVCIPSSSEISVQISEQSKSNAYISFDGQSSCLLKKGDWMTIKHSESDLVFLQPHDQEQSQLPEWMERLQQFLGWNQGFKSPKCEQLQKRLPKIIQKTHSLHGMQLDFGKSKRKESENQNISHDKVEEKKTKKKNIHKSDISQIKQIP